MRPIYQIYVEEQLIDLDPKTVIAITLQAADFASGDLINRKASFTNQIKVPATQTNIRIFEYLNNPKSGSAFPYIKKTMQILCNGIKIMNGIVVVKQFDNYFNLQLYSIARDLAYQIANKYLSDLDFGDSPITWDQSFMDSKRASTSGWCSPVMNYGQMDDTVAADIGNYNLPSISYKDIVTTILSNAGYSVSGSFYTSNSTFNNMILTYGRDSFYGTSMTIDQALPTDVLQTDFLRDFLIKFGAFFRFNGFNIEILLLEDILNNVIGALDWTNKRIKNNKDIIQYTLSNWAQINNFKYTDVDNRQFYYDLIAPVNGQLDIPNENLPETRNIYTSIFAQPEFTLSTASTELGKFEPNAANNIYCCTSSVYETLPSSFIFDNKPKPMLAVLRDRDAGIIEGAVKFNGSSRTDYKVADFGDFYNLSGHHDYLKWSGNFHSDGLLDIYYPSLQRVFNAGIISTTHEYLLNDIDINSIDLLTPIFDDGNYYLINKINNYVSGRTTRVELLKI